LKQIRKRFTYANVMSSIAVFFVLGGATALAATKIGANELKANSIKTGKIVKEAVTQGKIKNNAVNDEKIASDAITAAKVKDGSLTVADLKAGTIPAPVNAYTKAESDGRYLRNTVVVVKTLANAVAKDNFETGTVECPSGYQALSGGVDPNGVFYGKVSASAPMINGKRTEQTADGQYGPATGWFLAVTTQGTTTGTEVVKMAVVCSPLG
jgi:hypothetical protein